MKTSKTLLTTVAAAIACSMPAFAEDDDAYSQALKDFKDQPATAEFFANSVGYALFPTIGKGGIGIGGAFGKGRAYRNGQHVGNVKPDITVKAFYRW